MPTASPSASPPIFLGEWVRLDGSAQTRFPLYRLPKDIDKAFGLSTSKSSLTKSRALDTGDLTILTVPSTITIPQTDLTVTLYDQSYRKALEWAIREVCFDEETPRDSASVILDIHKSKIISRSLTRVAAELSKDLPLRPSKLHKPGKEVHKPGKDSHSMNSLVTDVVINATGLLERPATYKVVFTEPKPTDVTSSALLVCGPEQSSLSANPAPTDVDMRATDLYDRAAASKGFSNKPKPARATPTTVSVGNPNDPSVASTLADFDLAATDAFEQSATSKVVSTELRPTDAAPSTRLAPEGKGRDLRQTRPSTPVAGRSFNGDTVLYNTA